MMADGEVTLACPVAGVGAGVDGEVGAEDPACRQGYVEVGLAVVAVVASGASS